MQQHSIALLHGASCKSTGLCWRAPAAATAAPRQLVPPLQDVLLQLFELRQRPHLDLGPVAQGDHHIPPQSNPTANGHHVLHFFIRRVKLLVLPGRGGNYGDSAIGEPIFHEGGTAHGGDGERQPDEGGAEGHIDRSVPGVGPRFEVKCLVGEVVGLLFRRSCSGV